MTALSSAGRDVPVLDIDVGGRLLAIPYLGSLLRLMCRHDGLAGPEGDRVPNEIIALLERIIVEVHRRGSEADLRLRLVAGPRPRVRLHVDSPIAEQVATEVLNRARAVSRDAEVAVTDHGMIVELPTPDAHFAALPVVDPFSRSGPTNRSDGTSPTDPRN